jgi:hypothetical protein
VRVLSKMLIEQPENAIWVEWPLTSR